MAPSLPEKEEKACLEKVLWPSHEPLQFMRRRGGIRLDYAQYYEDYQKPENIRLWAKLLGSGGMPKRLHFFKGMGLEMEREEIDRTIEVVKIIHAEGMRASVYVGGTMHTDWFYDEVPEAREWETVDLNDRPITYQGFQLWRYFPCINNPDYREYVKKVLDVAIDEVGADEIFFDNQILRAEPRSCRCNVCLELFPSRVEAKYTPEERVERFGHEDVSGITPPLWSDAWPPTRLHEIQDPVIQEWIDFRCETVHDFFLTMREYIQGKKPATSVGMNIKGIHAHNLCFNNGIDHGRWQEAGFNCCDAGLYAHVGPHKNLIAEFRAYKITHTTGLSQSPQSSERDNLICVVINKQLDIPGFGRRPDMGNIRLFGNLGRFLREHEADLYGTRPIAMDVAVLRSFPSMAYTHANWTYGPFIAEQGLWEARIPFGIIFDQNLDDLSRHRVILLANQNALSDRHVARLKAFVEFGGGLVATGDTGIYDDWRRQRTVSALAEAFGIDVGGKAARKKVGDGRVAYVPRLVPKVEFEEDLMRHMHGKHEDSVAPKNWKQLEAALKWASGGSFSHAVGGPFGFVAEYRQGPAPRDKAVHLINFKDQPIQGKIDISVEVEPGSKWSIEVLSPDPLPKRKPGLKRSAGRVSFSLPGLGVYTACILRRAGPGAS